MKKSTCSALLASLLIPVGGIAVLAICYAGYLGVYLLIESVFFPNVPQSVPAGIIRIGYAIALVLLYFLLLSTKAHVLLKAILFIGPMATLQIAVILALYIVPVMAAVSVVVLASCCFYILHRHKSPWFFYYAEAMAVLVAIAYAWPRAL